MSIGYSQKLRAIRKHEGLTQGKFAELTGISLGSVKNYETGHSEVGLSTLERVVNCPKLSKYTLWLMTDTTSPEAGQIAPPVPDQEEERAKKSNG